MVSRELWMAMRDEEVVFFERANNSVMTFRKGEPFLSFYIEACKRIVRSRKGDFPHTAIGTKFLTGIAHRLSMIVGAVTFSPLNLIALYNNDDELNRLYFKNLASPIHAVNLCLTFRDMTYRGTVIDDLVYTTIMENLASGVYQTRYGVSQ